MPTAFQKELSTLAQRLADLCALVAIAVGEATRCVLESDRTLGGRVREDAAAIAALGVACEDQACALLALHTPREEGVKAVVAAVHAAADLTRMGGLALEVAEPRWRVPVEARPALGRLGEHAVAAARALRGQLAGEDGSGVTDAVALAGTAERELREQARGTADVVLLAAAYGRFAGTAASIARRMAKFVPVAT
ncbi:PhoU domain-containing protein [Amycolatopsis kentuckyensis]|uniref:PhoU domain-containing protein n=1 Tax=Amycolatopsis kentuckyensis TaxID=218823 RepID=UPI003562D96F